jgi:hypothetical protein
LIKTSRGGQQDDADVHLLALVAAGFPDYRIWRAITHDRIQYVAQAVDLAAHPHTLVTASLDELTTELTSAQPGAPQ